MTFTYKVSKCSRQKTYPHLILPTAKSVLHNVCYINHNSFMGDIYYKSVKEVFQHRPMPLGFISMMLKIATNSFYATREYD